MTAPRCQRCGAPLDSTAENGLCAACLLHSALDPAGEEALDPAAPRLPRDFGNYRLLEEIGRGGMGVVYRAEHARLRRIVAIKLQLAGAHASEVALLRFREEAAVAALEHPNIIAIHDYGEVDGQPFYTMDLVEGHDLAAVCDGRPLPARRAAEILRALAEAVHHAHSRGVIHRDLKPSNVLIDSMGRPRLADFGLAKHIGAAAGATLTGQMLGSPSYVPPEQAGAAPAHNAVSSDVYGLGALLYHGLTGRAPFTAATPTETLRLVLETDPAPPHLLTPGLPRDLETICLKCLAKDPLRRYATADEVADELGRFLGDKPILARPPGWMEQAAKFCRRHRTAVITTSTVLCAILTVVTAAFSALLRERAALARALRAEHGQAAARDQAGEFAAFMIGDLGLTMKRYGNSAMLLRIAEQTDAYYRQLPPDLLDRAARMRHAAALEQLGGLRLVCRGDHARGVSAMREAVAHREAIAREDPEDGEAAALLIWAEWQLAWMSGDEARTANPAWREDQIRRLREIRVRRPDCPPAIGCLAWFLCRDGSMLARDPARLQEGMAKIIEGNEVIDTLPEGASLDADNHLYATIQGCRAMLASALSAAGDHARAVEVQEQCLARFMGDWAADTGHLMLRELVAQSAIQLSTLALNTSLERALDAEAVARGHFQALIELDPENLRYRHGYINAHSHTPLCLVRQGKWREARAALLAWDRAYEAMQDRAGAWVPDLRHAELPLWIAGISAALGDAAEARRWIDKVPTRLDFQIRADAKLDGPSEQARAAQSSACIALRAGDWPEAGRLMEEARGRLETLRATRPDDPELNRRVALMRGLEGLWLARQGRLEEAAASIGDVVPDLPLQAAELPRLDYRAVRRLIVGEWCEILLRTGRPEEALPAAEAMLSAQEAECARHPLDISAQELLAADLVRVAGLLPPTSPAGAARRRALLDRAASLAASARANGAWQTRDDEKVGARLRELLEASPQD